VFDATAIVPTLGRLPELEACLGSLAATSPSFRHVLVIDQSDGRGAEVARHHGADAITIESRGLSHARNRGLEQAVGTWCFFPDDDCTVAPDFTSRCIEFIDREPAAGFLCARVEAPGGRVLSRGMGEVRRPIRTAHDVLTTGLSAGLVVRRRVFDRIGPFDERFGVGSRYPSGEESDLLLRAIHAGLPGWYVPEARVFHPDPHQAADPSSRVRRAESYGRGWGALMARHRLAGLHTLYLVRALGGAALATLTGRAEEARRHGASFRGRRDGYRAFRSEFR